MADFAKWSVATEAFDPGVFLRAFESAAREQNEAVAESDPVVIAIATFMMARDSWEGTVAGLLQELGKSDRSEAAPTSWKKWPTEPSAFGKQLRSASPVLQKLGVGVEFAIATSRNRTRSLRLFKVEIADTSDTTARGSPASSASPTTSGSVEKFEKPPRS
jgi:hypothetical protein